MDEQINQQLIDLTDKIHHLEVSSAYQEDVIEHLNKTLGKQHQEIQLLQTQVKVLSDYIKQLKYEIGSDIKLPSEEVPPPHY
ncbi:SlyX protein [Thiomicrospira sp. XS5]|jgi:SlyX protein|uniref:SlyX family protein n=1 Tax=Hydrogenovibrio thermophilus TaxID=265883 RepID=A0A410H395_9GAMM|nr:MULTISPECIES: SlyX family protein [Piscirickettsiaceae]AZR82087.1 SlyX protein [Thiomicrospira sp. S5]KUJ75280.1 SlyX protein [Thiomicrospira sp. XS5]QAB15376.1 SlyX family protein [Hydrogenovibrio thermophilus]